MSSAEKIYVIFTGGTIGSAATGNGTLDTDAAASYALLSAYNRLPKAKNIEFVSAVPYEALSENVRPQDISLLCTAVEQAEKTDVRGVIITHGTDTLAYTAAYLGLSFADIRVPVVLVSADAPVADPLGNALPNFAGAVDFILTENLPGVFVSYQNPGEACNIHLASRLMQARQHDGRFDSLSGVAFGEMQNGTFVRNEHPQNPHPAQFASRPVRTRHMQLGSDILFIKAHSFIRFAAYDFTAAKPRAVLVETYHSGTVGPVDDFLAFCDMCLKNGVGVVLAGVIGKAYAGTEKIYNHPAVILAKNMSVETAFIKTNLAYHNFSDAETVRSFIEHGNYFFERLD